MLRELVRGVCDVEGGGWQDDLHSVARQVVQDVAYGRRAPGTLRDESWVADLPTSVGYAVVWLEIY